MNEKPSLVNDDYHIIFLDENNPPPISITEIIVVRSANIPHSLLKYLTEINITIFKVGTRWEDN